MKLSKRIFDLTLALILLVSLAPVMVIVAGMLKCLYRGPILFKQVRPGCNEQPFTLYKFRTMYDARNSKGKTLPDAVRLHQVGKWLRRLSLDELPQLVNILKGEMSFIGPRPLLMEYLPHYTAAQRRRHNVLPGITGLAQVHGRNSLSWSQRFHYDLEYVGNQSWRMDIKIVFLTLKRIATGSGTQLVDTKFSEQPQDLAA